MEESSVLEASMKLLKGERDEQRLAGLLFFTKSCNGDDLASIRSCYNAVGSQFLDRLLKTGMGKGATSSTGGDNRDAYLQLSVTFLAAFCRVPEIASSEEMVSKIPLILEIIPNQPCSPFLEECYEFLFLVSTASENGVRTLYRHGVMSVLASQMPALPDGSRSLELAIKLVQLFTTNVSLDLISKEFPLELAMMVSVIARQFAVLHDALKFELLHFLTAVLSSNSSEPFYDSLRSMASNTWSTYLRVGIIAVLNNRVAPVEKLQALILADSMLSIMGEMWLIDQINLPDIHDSIPVDRCLLLVLETSRVEVSVLLNEISYLKHEAPKNASNGESIVLKKKNLSVAFSLVEKIIKLISSVSENEECVISESTLTKLINGFNETINVVLEYLQDAKDHRQNQGDDLLASVRVIGSYLAETPLACEEKVRELLEYMLSVKGEDESSPFYSVCFLLPMLCQIAMEIEGCKILVSSGAYKAVSQCLVKLIEQRGHMVENNDSIFLACDTILNLLVKKEQVQLPFDEDTFVHLLKALAEWAGATNDSTDIMMASCICSLLFDYTSEEALLNYPNFDQSTLNCLCHLIARSLATCWQDMSADGKNDKDLFEIITAGYSRWSHCFPRIKAAIAS